MTYRVIQWATGGVGRAAIEGILDHPELELAGVWVHSAEKDGRDVGELLGREPIGVTATTDKEALLALEADAVLYAPVMADPRVVDRILRAGKDVVTPLGWFYPTDEDRAELVRNGVKLVEEPVRKLEGNECLERMVLASGEAIPCDALFFSQGPCLPSPLAERLGCEISDKGVVETYSYEKTNVPGLYVAGDASRRVQFAIVAAAEGAMAAFAINTDLTREDLDREARA